MHMICRKMIRDLIVGALLSASACGCTAKPWPESPLYVPPANAPAWATPATEEDARAEIQGHYAHYDVVAYITQTPAGPMRTFIISYGFTDFIPQGQELIELDRFCHAEYRVNQPFAAVLSDVATQAIQPRTAAVQVFREGEAWNVFRPATPVLIGIDGDPDQPLPSDPMDPNISDPDRDGKPGVTVRFIIYGFIRAELYVARREIFQNDLTLYSDGSLRGTVTDSSEQLVIGATLPILNTPNSPPQYDDPGLNPVLLIPAPDDLDTCEELMSHRDALFPPEPAF